VRKVASLLAEALSAWKANSANLAYHEFSHGLSDLIEPTHRRTIGVGEGHVFSVGEEVLHRLGFPLKNSPCAR
jgi:hypothetical protein